MDFKPTSTNGRQHRRSAGATLVEAIVSVGISGLVLVALASILMVSGRSFASFSNYVDLDTRNRTAMDTLTRDLRECNRVLGYNTTTLVIEDPAGLNVIYYYSPWRQTLTRYASGSQTTLLTGCDSLLFTISQRNPVGGTYDVYPAATPSTAKVVNVSWNCSRTIFGQKANTENVQTARIVIRRQG